MVEMLGAPLSIKQKLADLYRQRSEAFERIEQQGGVDYKYEMYAIQKKIDALTGALKVPSTNVTPSQWAEYKKNFQAGVSTNKSSRVAEAIVEALVYHDIGDDDGDSDQDIASDFVENELGRFDWVANWKVVKQTEDPAARVKAYLDMYQIAADPLRIVAYIDRMAESNPNRWR